MIDRLSRGKSLGAIFILLSGLLAVTVEPSPAVCMLAHIGLTVLVISYLRRTGRAGNIIVVTQVSVVLLFSLFCAYVLTLVNNIAYEPAFEFSVFSAESVKRALLLNDFALGISLFVYGAVPSLQRPSKLFAAEKIQEAARNTGNSPMFFPIGIIFSWGIIALLSLTPTVFQAPYPENQSLPWNIQGAPRLMLVLVPFGLLLVRFTRDQYRITRMGTLLRITTYCAIFAGLLSGARGGLIGLLIGLIALDISFCRNAPLWKWTSVGASVAIVLFAFINWTYMRVRICSDGFLPSFWGSFGNYSNAFSAKSSFDTVYLSDFPMLGQSIFHFLYSIALVDSGYSLQYRTFLNLIPQQLPEILDGVLWKRPLNDNWLLMEHFHHGGGFYSYANAYWNGGIAPLGLFAACLAWVIARIEIFFKTLPVYFGAAYFLLLLVVPVGFYYGIQGLVRGFEYSIVTYFGIRFLSLRLDRLSVRDTK
jgi:hypothetical protein